MGGDSVPPLRGEESYYETGVTLRKTVKDNLDNAVDNGINVVELCSKLAHDLIEDMIQCGGLPDNLPSKAQAYNAAMQWKRDEFTRFTHAQREEYKRLTYAGLKITKEYNFGLKIKEEDMTPLSPSQSEET